MTPEQMRALADSLLPSTSYKEHRAALRTAADQLEYYEHAHNLVTREWHEDQMRTAADDLDRLRAVIENAPHGRACRWLYSTSHPCTCWKADAL